MDILIEEIDLSMINNEVIEEAETGKKNHFISGVFIQGDVKNGNGRVYPSQILGREVKKLNETKIASNRLIGELDHPNTTQINLDRVSHLIKELRMDGNMGFGKAMLIETPCGKIAKSLLEAGVKLGVSSRGVGSVRGDVVQSDFNLKTIDIVGDPSAPKAFVDHILESQREWVLENGILTEKDVEDAIEKANRISIEHKYSVEDKKAAFIKLFTEAIETIKSK